MTDGQLRYVGRMDVALTASVNDWAPTGIGASTSIYIDPDAAWNITGILAEGFAGGGNESERVLYLHNEDATFSISLVGLSGLSFPANQFAWSGTITIGRGESIAIKYDGTASLWRLAPGRVSAGGSTLPVDDATAIAKGSSDATKLVRFECDTLVPTGTTVALAVPAANGTIATLALAETLTNKTLTTPTIGSFANATHSHTNAAGGGTLAAAAVAPPGSDTQVLFNDGGVTAGDAGLTYDKTNDQISPTHLKVGGVTCLSGDVAVTVSATPQADWAPTGLATAGWLRVNPDTVAVSISGIAAPASPFNDGRELTIYNIGTGGFALNFLNANVGSAVANRFDMVSNVAVLNGECVTFQYDLTSTRWRLKSLIGPAQHTHAGSTTGGTLDASAIAAGTMATARLGSGTASAITLLHGDQTYKAQSTFVTLGSDVSNSNATPDTMEDVTGLSFSVTAGETYWFRANIGYTAAATTTGSRWSCNGPTVTSLFYTTQYHSSSAGINAGGYTTYDQPAASSANSSLTDNRAVIEGVITPSANGTLVIRHASEIASSAITAKAGSWLEWRRIA